MIITPVLVGKDQPLLLSFVVFEVDIYLYTRSNPLRSSADVHIEIHCVHFYP